MLRKIKKSKIRWVLSDDYIVALGKLQATIYYTYDLTNRVPFDVMRKRVLRSKPEEYNSWADIIELATKHGVVGHGAKIRKEWLES